MLCLAVKSVSRTMKKVCLAVYMTGYFALSPYVVQGRSYEPIKDGWGVQQVKHTFSFLSAFSSTLHTIRK